ncbi:MAG TPA: sigma-70 region 4 domain-containing protein, partial [Solirubrobacteraceae bacterium]|nr:sigma-70 region 4 domain-containing protein [Solirubrobacteraceae bacterium]
ERARLAMLMDDLAALPDRARNALVMRELSGLTHEDIAIALDISDGAAKQAIFEARRGLHECAEGRAMLCAEVCRAISDGDRRVLRGRRVRAHIRDCASCAAFARSVKDRRRVLATVPVAPTAALGLAGAGAGVGAGGLTVTGGAIGIKGIASLCAVCAIRNSHGRSGAFRRSRFNADRARVKVDCSASCASASSRTIDRQ